MTIGRFLLIDFVILLIDLKVLVLDRYDEFL
jgi:hypothetical protein